MKKLNPKSLLNTSIAIHPVMAPLYILFSQCERIAPAYHFYSHPDYIDAVIAATQVYCVEEGDQLWVFDGFQSVHFAIEEVPNMAVFAQSPPLTDSQIEALFIRMLDQLISTLNPREAYYNYSMLKAHLPNDIQQVLWGDRGRLTQKVFCEMIGCNRNTLLKQKKRQSTKPYFRNITDD